MRCKSTPAVGTCPSAARTVLGWHEGGRTCVVSAARRGNGSGPEVPMGGKEHSSASAEAKEANISKGSLGGGPSRKPIPLWARRWSSDSRRRLRCSPLNLIFRWLQPLKPLVTSCAMLLRNPELPTPGFWLMASLNSLQLMFSQLIARSSFKLTLPSCALSSPTALFLGISAVTIPNSALFLRPVGLLSTTNLNKGATLASLSLPRVLPVHAYKSSPVTASKLVLGRVGGSWRTVDTRTSRREAQ